MSNRFPQFFPPHGAAKCFCSSHRGTPLTNWFLLILGSLIVRSSVAAADFPFTFTRTPAGEYRLTLEQNSAVYFGLQHTTDLQSFGTIKMALGTPGPIFAYTPLPAETRGFFRLEGISVYAPRDSDFDGMDDIWELGHSYLDPLNPSDAPLPSPNLSGKTNLEEYQLHFNYSSAKPQYYSREASVYNFGAPRFSMEAISREVALFNFGSPLANMEANSREVSVFNGEALPIAGYPEVYSREATLYNFGSPLTTLEALSREVSLFNGEQIPLANYPEIYSREVSIFNFGTPIHSLETISREVSVVNNLPN